MHVSLPDEGFPVAREGSKEFRGRTYASPGKEAGVFDFVLQSFHCLIFYEVRFLIPHYVADLRNADKLAKRKDA